MLCSVLVLAPKNKNFSLSLTFHFLATFNIIFLEESSVEVMETLEQTLDSVSQDAVQLYDAAETRLG